MMEKKYPVIQIARDKLKEMGKDMHWLELETGRTTRWYANNPAIEKIEYQVLVKMSKALNFDFIADHRNFLGQSDPDHQLKELVPEYQKEEKKISLQLSINGTLSSVHANFPKLLKLLNEEGVKLGLEIQQ